METAHEQSAPNGAGAHADGDELPPIPSEVLSNEPRQKVHVEGITFAGTRPVELDMDAIYKDAQVMDLGWVNFSNTEDRHDGLVRVVVRAARVRKAPDGSVLTHPDGSEQLNPYRDVAVVIPMNSVVACRLRDTLATVLRAQIPKERRQIERDLRSMGAAASPAPLGPQPPAPDQGPAFRVEQIEPQAASSGAPEGPPSGGAIDPRLLQPGGAEQVRDEQALRQVREQAQDEALMALYTGQVNELRKAKPLPAHAGDAAVALARMLWPNPGADLELPLAQVLAGFVQQAIVAHETQKAERASDPAHQVAREAADEGARMARVVQNLGRLGPLPTEPRTAGTQIALALECGDSKRVCDTLGDLLTEFAAEQAERGARSTRGTRSGAVVVAAAPRRRRFRREGPPTEATSPEALAYMAADGMRLQREQNRLLKKLSKRLKKLSKKT